MDSESLALVYGLFFGVLLFTSFVAMICFCIFSSKYSSKQKFKIVLFYLVTLSFGIGTGYSVQKNLCSVEMFKEQSSQHRQFMDFIGQLNRIAKLNDLSITRDYTNEANKRAGMFYFQKDVSSNDYYQFINTWNKIITERESEIKQSSEGQNN